MNKLLKDVTYHDDKRNEVWVLHRVQPSNAEYDFSVDVLLKDIDKIYKCALSITTTYDDVERWFTNAYEQQTSILKQIRKEQHYFLASVIEDEIDELAMLHGGEQR